MTRLAIFDLDGTLLDTAADLGDACNYALRQCGFPEHPLRDYYQMVGRGIYNLFRAAVPGEYATEDNVQRMAFHSEPVQEIMGTIPSWITRWGITVIFGIFLIIFIGCCLIRYPQTIASKIIITSSNPPSRITARFSGLLDTVTVDNGNKVKKGDIIALLATTASYGDIMKVKSFIEESSSRSLKDILSDTIFNCNFELGNIQVLWTETASIADEYARFCSIDLAGRQSIMTKDRINKNTEYYEYLVTQRKILLEDISIQRRIMNSDSILLEKEAISEYEFQASRQSYLAKLNSLTGFESSMKAASSLYFNCIRPLMKLNLTKSKKRMIFMSG